jgi:four helix bundle protein
MDLVELIYRATSRFPSEEKFGLQSQLRRAAVSIPSNIAEGQGRDCDGDFVRFLAVANGSRREVETQAILAQRLGYMSSDDCDHVLVLCDEIGRLRQGLLNSLNRRR